MGQMQKEGKSCAGEVLSVQLKLPNRQKKEPDKVASCACWVSTKSTEAGDLLYREHT